MPTLNDTTALIAEADKCVLCGMCLPHCPTYVLAQNENESPRGRLMLGKALLEGKLERTAHLLEHVEHCLLCRSCERGCPSGVQFGSFMDGLRQQLAEQFTDRQAGSNRLIAALEEPGKRQQLNQQLWLAQRTGLAAMGKWFAGSTNQRLLQSLPTVTRFKPLDRHYPATNAQARVMLFTGCSSELLGNELVRTATRVLNQLGIDVEIPANQQCCGGLSRHHGQQQQADRLAEQNLTAFDDPDNIPVLSLASGCGASLLDYSDAFRSRVMDITHYLADYLRDKDIAFRTLDETVVLHTPCSLQNIMRQAQAVPELLGRIPGLKIVPLSKQKSCCGAAGTYMYEQPAMADALRAPIIDQLASQRPSRLVTTNIGCAMHIASGLREAGLDIDVMHPVELLAEALFT